MISADGVTLSFGEQPLFQDVNVKFTPGNCYGLIGANGAGKSTFLKILAGEISADYGSVHVPPGLRVAVLKQNQFEFDDCKVMATVLMGNKKLYRVMEEKEALYAKADFSDADGIRASELEAVFADLNGWEAESQAAEMLEALGVKGGCHENLMKDLDAGQKVRVLLAQALFGNPDVLLLDEPTNNLDLKSIAWLEEFLCDFKNTVVVISHDRHFLDKVTTHIADIDFNKITLYSGNYGFWYQSSQLMLKQRQDRNRKVEDKQKELKAFIERFSANASKSRQATSRKKMLSKLNVEEIKPSSRRYPHIDFQQEREAGKSLLMVKGLAAPEGQENLFENLNFSVTKGEKIAFVGADTRAASALFDILNSDRVPAAGEVEWGVTTSIAYLPKTYDSYFEQNLSLLDWLRQYATTQEEMEEEYVRGFLGKMLFSGQEVMKKTSVLSGGEKVRCMLAMMMMKRANVLVLNEPTNHLDLESITALNNSLIKYKGTILLISQDREMVETVATRIIEIAPKGMLDKVTSYEEFLCDEQLAAQRETIYDVPPT